MSDAQVSGGGPASQGSWSVDPGLIAEIARREALDTPGVVSVLSAGLAKLGFVDRLTGRVSGGGPEIRGGQVPLEISVVGQYGSCLQELGERIRERTARAVESMTGYRVSCVDVTVADLHVSGEPLPTRQPGPEGSPGADGSRVDF